MHTFYAQIYYISLLKPLQCGLWTASVLTVYLRSRTTDTQSRHKSMKSENLSRCGRQNMLRSYLQIWEWEWIFWPCSAVKGISSLGVRSPCLRSFQYYLLLGCRNYSRVETIQGWKLFKGGNYSRLNVI